MQAGCEVQNQFVAAHLHAGQIGVGGAPRAILGLALPLLLGVPRLPGLIAGLVVPSPFHLLSNPLFDLFVVVVRRVRVHRLGVVGEACRFAFAAFARRGGGDVVVVVVFGPLHRVVQRRVGHVDLLQPLLGVFAHGGVGVLEAVGVEELDEDAIRRFDLLGRCTVWDVEDVVVVHCRK